MNPYQASKTFELEDSLRLQFRFSNGARARMSKAIKDRPQPVDEDTKEALMLWAGFAADAEKQGIEWTPERAAEVILPHVAREAARLFALAQLGPDKLGEIRAADEKAVSAAGSASASDGPTA